MLAVEPQDEHLSGGRSLRSIVPSEHTPRESSFAIRSGFESSSTLPSIGTDTLEEKFTKRKDSVKTFSAIRSAAIQRLLESEGRPTSFTSWFNLLCSARSEESGHWIDSNQARTIVASFVIANTIYIGASANFENVTIFEHAGYAFTQEFVVELFFLVFFLAELLLRLRSERKVFFRKVMNYLDLCLLIGSFASVVMFFFAAASIDLYGLTALRTARVVVVTRSLRVLRLLRVCRPMLLIVKGLRRGAWTLFWFLILIVLSVYITAILFTRFVGQQSNDEATKMLFGSLGKSMFTLFTFITMEDWPQNTRHLMNTEPGGHIMAFFIVIFIFCMHICLLNLVTAIMVEHILKITQEDKDKNHEKLQRERTRNIQELGELFASLGDNNDEVATVTFEEFATALQQNTHLVKLLSKLGIDTLHAEEIFHTFDFNGDGEVSKTEFIHGVNCLNNGTATGLQLHGVHYDLHQMWNMLGCGQERNASWAEQLSTQLCLQSESAQHCYQKIESRLEELIEEQTRKMEHLLNRTFAEHMKFDKESDLKQLAQKIDSIDEKFEAFPVLVSESEHRITDLISTIAHSTCQAETTLHVGQWTETFHDNARSSSRTGSLDRNIESVLPHRGTQMGPGLDTEFNSPSVPRTTARETFPSVSSTHVAPVDLSYNASTRAEPEPHFEPGNTASDLTGWLRAEIRDEPPSVTPEPTTPLSQSYTYAPSSRSLPQIAPDRSFGCASQFNGCASQLSDGSWRQTSWVPRNLMPSASPWFSNEVDFRLLVGPPRTAMDDGVRLHGVVRWVQQQNLGAISFHKLILKLDALGVELSIPEQDQLKAALRIMA